MKKYLFTSLVILFISACREHKEEPKEITITQQELRDLVTLAISGSSSANDSLSVLIDESYPQDQEYNGITVSEYRSRSGKKYCYVLLEHPNPLYNRFAVYDSLLNLYLLHKDLSGVLEVQDLDISGNSFLLLKESFLTRDEININRIHIIKSDTSRVIPVLNLIAGITTPNAEYRQIIEEIGSDTIKTKIRSKRKIPDSTDIFVYDESKSEYVSGRNIFRNMVMEIVTDFKSKNTLPYISDSLSAMASLGLVNPSDTLSESGNRKVKGFSFTFNEGWKEIENLVLSDYLSQNMEGTKFINTMLGSEISIIEIPYKDSSEQYVKYSLPQKSEGKYKMRFSQQFESGKYYIQFFEYACGRKKFLLVFQTSKHTYYPNKELFGEILNSFSMEC